MLIGLKRGYVRLGTVNHKVLQLMVGQPVVSFRSLCDAFRTHYPEVPNAGASIANTLTRLQRAAQGKPWKFLYVAGRERDSFGNPYKLYSLTRLHERAQVSKLTPAERYRRYRARKKRVVNSVFNFRGQIPVHEGENDGLESRSSTLVQRGRPSPAPWQEGRTGTRAG